MCPRQSREQQLVGAQLCAHNKSLEGVKVCKVSIHDTLDHRTIVPCRLLGLFLDFTFIIEIL